jgi:hypothetical protein
MKVCIQRTTFKVIEDQVITLASPFVPKQLVQTIPPVFNYVVSNQKYIQKKKCGVLVHPRKVIKTIPSMAAGNIISSDFLSNAVDNIDDKSIHDLAHAAVVFVKYAMMVL